MKGTIKYEGTGESLELKILVGTIKNYETV